MELFIYIYLTIGLAITGWLMVNVMTEDDRERYSLSAVITTSILAVLLWPLLAIAAIRGALNKE